MVSPGSMTLEIASAPGDRLDTLPPWTWDPFDVAAPLTLGWGVAAWLESWLIQPNGPRAGKSFRLTPRQLRFLLWWYAVDDTDLRWIFNHGARRLAKGSGKSPFAAVTALAEFCGPVRVERKDDRAPGGLRGQAAAMPWVQIAATSESQTKNTMRMVRAFAGKGSRVVVEHGIDVGKTVYYKVPEGTLEVITSSPTAAEGAESSLVVADETEWWTPARGGDDLAETLEDNLTKSGQRMLETANAWVPGSESVAERTWDAWVAQEEGRLKDDAGRVLYDAVTAPPGTDMSDYDSLRSALEFVYADCQWVDIEAIVRRVWSPKASPSESKRKYLNWPTAPEDSWVEPTDWSILVDQTRVVVPDEPVVLFFDGSKSRDATALVGCCVNDGHVFVPRQVDGSPTIWEPTQDGHDVPVEEVDLAVDHTFDTLNVVGFFADVREWESFTKVEWPRRYAERLLVQAVPAGKTPEPIAWDMRTKTHDFTLAAELAHDEISRSTTDERAFTHDGNPILSRHVANARGRLNRWGTSVSKETPDSAKKIDAAVCFIGARMVRRLVLAKEPKRQRSNKASFL